MPIQAMAAGRTYSWLFPYSAPAHYQLFRLSRTGKINYKACLSYTSAYVPDLRRMCERTDWRSEHALAADISRLPTERQKAPVSTRFNGIHVCCGAGILYFFGVWALFKLLAKLIAVNTASTHTFHARCFARFTSQFVHQSFDKF